jgi:serine/threonine protein kinase
LNTANFARKQLRQGTPIETFIQERQNLDLVNQLKDRHIVQIVKSYRKGDEFNIVFPRAKANLKECLERPPLMLTRLTAATGPLREAGMWKQMRGLARALERIINYDNRNDTAQEVYQAPGQELGDRRILGYHFDLKPANVLVYDDDEGEDNVFKISDFGQAKFRDQAGGSLTTHAGGTENYAAPEMSTDEQRALNTRYDVWSLGCIFTELVTFVLKSYQGVRDFEAARERRRSGWTNYRYFDEAPRRGDERRFVLRRGVKDWIDNLLSPRTDATEADNAFLSEIKALLLGMLEVNVQERYTSTKVYQELERILNQDETDGGNSIPPELSESADSDLEMERDGQKIGALGSFFARNTRHPRADYHLAKLQVLETYPNLELTTTIRGHSSTYRGPCRELHFVPQFALRKGDHRALNDWDFRLITLGEPEKAANKFDYQCSKPSDARVLQGFLTGHEIRKTFELQGLRYKYHREWMSRTGSSLGRHYRGLLGRVSGRNENNRVSEQQDLEASSDDDPSPFTIQIWREFDRPVSEMVVLGFPETNRCSWGR